MIMEEIDELIKQYGLEEDPEHVIIPYTDKNGLWRRRFILKRPFIRIMYDTGYFVDYPLSDVIKAAVKYPGSLLSEALYRMNQEAIAAAADSESDKEKDPPLSV
jgi:hypothetical protein